MSSRSWPVIGGLITVLALAGCGADTSGGGADSDGKVAVVASTNVWGSVAQAVGGDAVSVESLITDSSGDPHAHPDKPSDAITVAEADLAVYNGGGYDDFFVKLLDSTDSGVRQVNAFELSAHAADAEEHEPADGGHDHDHGAVNEHVWYDLPTVATVADRIAEELGAVAPEHRDTFADNAAAFGDRLADLTERVEAIGTIAPGAKVVATEPVAAYLIEAAGLTDATPPEFSEAIEEESDPPLSAVARTTDLITGRQVVALVNNAQTETAVTGSLTDAASTAGVPVVEVTETLPPGVTDYVEWMSKQVAALASAVTPR